MTTPFRGSFSIVEFLPRAKRREELPLDDDLFEMSDDPEMKTDFVHPVLRNRVNFILNRARSSSSSSATSNAGKFRVNSRQYGDPPYQYLGRAYRPKEAGLVPGDFNL